MDDRDSINKLGYVLVTFQTVVEDLATPPVEPSSLDVEGMPASPSHTLKEDTASWSEAGETTGANTPLETEAKQPTAGATGNEEDNTLTNARDSSGSVAGGHMAEPDDSASLESEGAAGLESSGAERTSDD